MFRLPALCTKIPMASHMRRYFGIHKIMLPDLGEGTKEATIKEINVDIGDNVEEVSPSLTSSLMSSAKSLLTSLLPPSLLPNQAPSQRSISMLTMLCRLVLFSSKLRMTRTPLELRSLRQPSLSHRLLLHPRRLAWILLPPSHLDLEPLPLLLSEEELRRWALTSSPSSGQGQTVEFWTKTSNERPLSRCRTLLLEEESSLPLLSLPESQRETRSNRLEESRKA